jgi:hypothetical protein
MPYIKINRKIINVDDYKCPICGDPVDYFTDPRRRTVTVYCAESRNMNVVRSHFRATFPQAIPAHLRVEPPGPDDFDFDKEYNLQIRRPYSRPRAGSRKTPVMRKSEKTQRKARRA